MSGRGPMPSLLTREAPMPEPRRSGGFREFLAAVRDKREVPGGISVPLASVVLPSAQGRVGRHDAIDTPRPDTKAAKEWLARHCPRCGALIGQPCWSDVVPGRSKTCPCRVRDVLPLDDKRNNPEEER